MTWHPPLPAASSPLRDARTKAGLTQAALARLVGRHPSTIGLAEQYRPSPELARLAGAVLGVPPEKLLGVLP